MEAGTLKGPRREIEARPRWSGGRAVPAAARILLLSCCLSPTRLLALDGRINFHDTRQEGRIGAATYHQRARQSEVQGGQILTLGGSILLQLDGRYLRELYTSRIDSTSSAQDRRSGRGGFSIDYNSRRVRFGLNGEGLEQRNSGDGAVSPGLRRRQIGSSGGLRLGLVRLDAGGLYIDSRQQNPSAPDIRNKEWSGSLAARFPVPRLGQFGYRLSALIDQNPVAKSSESQISHVVTFGSHSRFAGGRGSATLQTTSNFGSQEHKRVLQTAGSRRLFPLVAGYVLDDTPEMLDPLEGELISAPALFDGDRQTPTAVNIGDSAPAVREFGGAYRNLVYDFGEVVDLSSATLYIDRTLLGPGFIDWQLYVRTDPDSVWAKLGPDAFEISYHEWGMGLQGWTVLFPGPVSARFFKMVDVKLGTQTPIAPDIYVTELEVYVRDQEVIGRESSNTANQRLGASLGYAVTSTLRAGYDLTYRRRTLSARPGAVEDASHGVSAGWNRGALAVSGRYEIRTLTGRNTRNNDTRNQSISARRGRSGSTSVDLSWSRVQDRTRDAEKTSNNLGASFTWPAAPALRFYQRVGVGRLVDHAHSQTSTSVVMSTRASGQPVPTVSIDLDWTDRRVSQEAGRGFSRFGDTSLVLVWQPLPLVSLQSQVRHQVRGRGDWLTQSTASWSPLSGGKVRTILNASHRRDTRTGETQRGGGVGIDWPVKPTVTLHGNVESVVMTRGGQRNSPLNMEFNGTWRF